MENKLFKQGTTVGIFKNNQLEDFEGNLHNISQNLTECSKEEYLAFAKKRYKKGSYFYTATKNIKVPLKVIELKTAQHEDRRSEIAFLEHSILREWLLISPKSAKINKNHRHYQTFLNKTETLRKRVEDLEAVGSDIVDAEEGGVIYCGTNNVWAEKYDV